MWKKDTISSLSSQTSRNAFKLSSGSSEKLAKKWTCMRKNLAENLDVREVYDIMTQALNQAGLRWFCPDCRHIDFGAHSLDKCPKCGNTSWEFYKWMD